MRRLLTCLPIVHGCGILVDDPPPGLPVHGEDDAPSCIRFLGPPKTLMPIEADARHHPTIDLLPNGGLIATWQVGKAPAYIAARTYSPDLDPLTDESIVYRRDLRATHPQIAMLGERGVIAWTSEVTESLRVAIIDAEGHRRSDPRTLVEDDALRPGRYVDLSFSPQGDLWAMWFGGNYPVPAWTIAMVPRTGPVATNEFYARQGFDLGGPSTLQHAPDGKLWVAWPEQSTRWLGRTSRVFLSPVNPGLGVERRAPVAQGERRWERTALAFTDHTILLGWTEYPFVAGDWQAWLMALDLDGAPLGDPVTLGPGHGSMVDVDALGDVGVVAWQEPDHRQTDIALMLVDDHARPLCDPVRVNELTAPSEARANVRLFRETADGQERLRGVVVWHTETDEPGVQGLGGRAFEVVRP